ncbi:MAG: DUF4255 domain-containing protein [Tardiphaga sp.]
MSSALAIAGVSAVIKDLLDSGLIDGQITDTMGQGVTVSVVAPDSIALGNDAAPRLNLFLHQVTPNPGWRNVGMPGYDASGQQRIGNPPLALDLHYLLTAYGSADLHAEVLLGYAMQLMHETPVLARKAIRKALNPPAAPVNGSLLPSVYQALRVSDLADQLEQIKITQQAMNMEELSKLWTALQAHYRPSAAYQATVVLIDPIRSARSSLPVLTRGKPIPDVIDPAKLVEPGVAVQTDLASPFPEIETISLPAKRIAALHGDTIEIGGHNLNGAGHLLLLSRQQLDIELQVTPASSVDKSTVAFVLPDDPANYPAGSYAAVVQLKSPGDTAPRQTNQLSLSIAPQITSLPAAASLDAEGNLTLTPSCKPVLRPDQRVSLILGGNEAPAIAFTAPTTTPTFKFNALPPGIYRTRLRVDGVDSPIVDRTKTPPVYSGAVIEVTS